MRTYTRDDPALDLAALDVSVTGVSPHRGTGHHLAPRCRRTDRTGGWLGVVRGDSAGSFTVPPGLVTAPGGFVHFFGGHDRTGKVAEPVDATPTESARAAARLLVRGVRVDRRRVRLTVSPASAGEFVLLQRPHGRSWTTVAKVRLDRRHQARFTLARTRQRLRFLLPAGSLHLAVTQAIRPGMLR